MIDTIQLFKVRGPHGAALHQATASVGLLMLAACAKGVITWQIKFN
jgi:hypothetical protein